MNLELRGGLLYASLSIVYQDRSQTVDNIILDTGAARSLIDRSAVDSLNLITDGDDIIVTMAGIGGNDYAVRKQIDSLKFASHTIRFPYLDFGNLDSHPGIDGSRLQGLNRPRMREYARWHA